MADIAVTAIRAGAANCLRARRSSTGISFDGGYADYMIAPRARWHAFPMMFRPSSRAPHVCRRDHVQRVAEQRARRRSRGRSGLGGLGHLGVQFAAKMGFTTVAIARGNDKEPLARKLGAANISTARAGPCGRTAETRRREGDACHRDRRAMARSSGAVSMARSCSLALAPAGVRLCSWASVRSKAGIPARRWTRRIRWPSARPGVRSMNETSLERGRGLRPHDERQGAVSSGADVRREQLTTECEVSGRTRKMRSCWGASCCSKRSTLNAERPTSNVQF